MLHNDHDTKLLGRASGAEERGPGPNQAPPALVDLLQSLNLVGGGNAGPELFQFGTQATGANGLAGLITGVLGGDAPQGLAGELRQMQAQHMQAHAQQLQARGVPAGNGSHAQFLTALLNHRGGVGPIQALSANPGDYAFGNFQNIVNQLMMAEQGLNREIPASKAAVEQLEKHFFVPNMTQDSATSGDASGAGGADSILDCAVCQEPYEAGEEVIRLPCGHLFHGTCILPWLDKHNSCPVCRSELPTDNAEYEARKRAATDPGPRER